MTLRAIFIFSILAILSCGNWTSSGNGSDQITWTQINKQLRKTGFVHLYNKKITGNWEIAQSAYQSVSNKDAKDHYTNGQLILINCEIEGQVNTYKSDEKVGHNSYWSGNIKFQKCHFYEDVNLKNINFRGDLDFSESVFHKDLSLVSSVIHGDIILKESIIAGEAKLGSMLITGDCNLFSCEIGGMFNMQGTTVRGQLQASTMTCDSYMDCSQIKSHGGAFFNYSKFNGGFSINNASFLDRVEIIGSEFKNPLSTQTICSLFPALVAEYKEDMHIPNLNIQCKS